MYTILPRSEGAVLGVEVTGKVTIQEEQQIIAKAEELIEDHDKISVLVVMGEHVGLSLEAAADDIKWVLTHMPHLNRLAVVTDRKLLAALVSADAVFARMVGIQEKHFDRQDLGKAWQWVES